MSEPRETSDRFNLGMAMLLIAGLAVGLWLLKPMVPSSIDWPQGLLPVLAFGLGGLAFVGVPLLLLERRRVRRSRRPWGPGRLMWFSTGTAAWLLWPPVVYQRIQGAGGNRSSATVCFAYGTPLMALYLTLALLAGGWLRRKARRRRAARSWREQFGLILGLAWAATGLYVLYMIYADDLK